jgi:hypothetical protein
VSYTGKTLDQFPRQREAQHMEITLFWIVIIGLVVLLGILIWLAMQSGKRRNRSRDMTDAPADTDNVSPAYAEDERRRREGTDGL